MKLVVKLPKDKPPFIGIVFDHESDAEKVNQNLITDHKYADYRIVFEFISDWVNVKLISNSIPAVKFYNKLSYDKEKLIAWFYITKNMKGFNFSQLYVYGNKECVAKTIAKQKLFVLKVDSYEVHTGEPDDFEPANVIRATNNKNRLYEP
ncbi:MAG: hypothetical protein H7141_05930 [Burkholderiales bacterium]|nr:hypothetical protein [Bacteroidia bacterium]